MILRKFYCLGLLLFLCFPLSSQIVLERKVFANAGGSVVDGTNYFAFTIGEAVIGTDQTQVPFLTKGFHQPINQLVLAPQIEEDPLIPQQSVEEGWKLFPNPASSQISFQYIYHDEGPKMLKIINLVGQVLFENWLEKEALDRGIEIELAHLPRGNYWLTCTGNGKKVIIPILLR